MNWTGWTFGWFAAGMGAYRLRNGGQIREQGRVSHVIAIGPQQDGKPWRTCRAACNERVHTSGQTHQSPPDYAPQLCEKCLKIGRAQGWLS